MEDSARLLNLLRTPRTRQEIQDHLGVSKDTTYQWIKAIRRVVNIKMSFEYPGGKGNKIVRYFWDEGLALVPTKYEGIITLTSCLAHLGATIDKIRAARDNYAYLDYKKWVDELFFKRIKIRPPSKDPEGFVFYNSVRMRAHEILDNRQAIPGFYAKPKP